MAILSKMYNSTDDVKYRIIEVILDGTSLPKSEWYYNSATGEIGFHSFELRGDFGNTKHLRKHWPNSGTYVEQFQGANNKSVIIRYEYMTDSSSYTQPNMKCTVEVYKNGNSLTEGIDYVVDSSEFTVSIINRVSGDVIYQTRFRPERGINDSFIEPGTGDAYTIIVQDVVPVYELIAKDIKDNFKPDKLPIADVKKALELMRSPGGINGNLLSEACRLLETFVEVAPVYVDMVISMLEGQSDIIALQKQTIDKYVTDIEAVTDNLSNAEDEVKDLKVEVKELEDKKDELETELKDKEDELNDARKDIESRDAQIAALNEMTSSLTSNISKLNELVAELEAKINDSIQ